MEIIQNEHIYEQEDFSGLDLTIRISIQSPLQKMQFQRHTAQRNACRRVRV